MTVSVDRVDSRVISVLHGWVEVPLPLRMQALLLWHTVQWLRRSRYTTGRARGGRRNRPAAKVVGCRTIPVLDRRCYRSMVERRARGNSHIWHLMHAMCALLHAQVVIERVSVSVIHTVIIRLQGRKTETSCSNLLVLVSRERGTVGCDIGRERSSPTMPRFNAASLGW